jgi:hypothetical protein
MDDATRPEVRSDAYFAIVPEWILDARFSPSAIITYLTLARFANRRSRTCYPSKETIVARSGLSPNTVSKALAELRVRGAVSSARRNRNGVPTSNVYVLHMAGPFGQPISGPNADFDDGQEALIPNSEALIPNSGIRIRQGNQTKERDISLSKSKFEDFWDAYPRRISKGSAKRAWDKATLKEDAEKIIEAAKRFAKSREGQDPRYTPHPATWLNGERWSDQPETLGPKDKREAENNLVVEALRRLNKKQIGVTSDE